MAWNICHAFHGNLLGTEHKRILSSVFGIISGHIDLENALMNREIECVQTACERGLAYIVFLKSYNSQAMVFSFLNRINRSFIKVDCVLIHYWPSG